MKKNQPLLLAALCISMLALSCNDKETISPEPEPGESQGKTMYIIASTPVGSQNTADYLLTTTDLNQGSITTVGNGKEQDGSFRYYLTHKNRFFSLLYGQGNPGAVTTYIANEKGELIKKSNFQSETVQVQTAVQDDILMIKVPRSGQPNANWYRVNAERSEIVGEGTLNIVKLAGNGERAHFTWASQVGDKVFAPYQCLRNDGISKEIWSSRYLDSTWVAVFTYPDMKLEKVIKDNRTGFIGSYYNNGLAQDEKGDVYGFSPAGSEYATPGNQLSSKPSAIIRIKKGSTEFDQSYFFNVQEKSGGYHIKAQNYIGKGKFLLEMFSEKGQLKGVSKLAVADVYTQSFKWVEGLPQNITSISSKNNLASEDGASIFSGITTSNTESRIYRIDAASAIATPGLKVEGGTITAINRLKY